MCLKRWLIYPCILIYFSETLTFKMRIQQHVVVNYPLISLKLTGKTLKYTPFFSKSRIGQSLNTSICAKGRLVLIWRYLMGINTISIKTSFRVSKICASWAIAKVHQSFITISSKPHFLDEKVSIAKKKKALNSAWNGLWIFTIMIVIASQKTTNFFHFSKIVTLYLFKHPLKLQSGYPSGKFLTGNYDYTIHLNLKFKKVIQSRI